MPALIHDKRFKPKISTRSKNGIKLERRDWVRLPDGSVGMISAVKTNPSETDGEHASCVVYLMVEGYVRTVEPCTVSANRLAYIIDQRPIDQRATISSLKEGHRVAVSLRDEIVRGRISKIIFPGYPPWRMFEDFENLDPDLAESRCFRSFLVMTDDGRLMWPLVEHIKSVKKYRI